MEARRGDGDLPPLPPTRKRAEAMEIYRRCRRHLSIVLGIPPATATEAIYRSLASGK